MRYIESLREGENLIEHYLCKSKTMCKSKTGKNYISLTLADKTGTVNGKIWELNNNIKNFEENTFIKIDASVQVFNNDLQLKIVRLRPSREGEYDPTDFVPSTKKNVDEMYSKIKDIINSIENKYLKTLLENIFYKNETISKEFTNHSAAKTMHHGYAGGLLEHTLSVAQTCDFLAGRYEFANRDLAVTAALLHDIAKIYELSNFPTNDYTDVGQLIGHIVMGAELVTHESKKIEDFPDNLRNLLKHAILAHHGELEYGSPVRPMTIEAYILHCADDLDAKLKMFEEAIDGSTAKWVGYQKMLQRNIRKTDL